MSIFSRKPPPKRVNRFADFMINGSAKEQKRVFKKVIEESIKDQQKIIDKANQIEAEAKRRSLSNKD